MRDRFEYMTVTDYTIHLDLNKYGADGWELVTIFRGNDGSFYYYFKRKVV